MSDAPPDIDAGAWSPEPPSQPFDAAVPQGSGSDSRPELLVAAAFGGGLVAALLLRRIGSGD